MGWRPSSWWARSHDRQPTAESSAAAPVAQEASVSPSQSGAWRDLPALTPLAATPVQRIALRDDFRSGLATHADPRFLRPLTHQVDPTVGGLVDGLAAVGLPSVHDDGPDLAVPIQRAVVSAAPRVQRRVAWSGSDELTTVRWELPEMLGAAETTDAVPDHESTIEPSSGAGGDRSESSVLGTSGLDSPLLGTPAAPDPLTTLEQPGQAEQAGPVAPSSPVGPTARVEPPQLPRPDGPATLQRTLASVDRPSPSVPTAVSVDPQVPARTGEIADVPVRDARPDAGDAPRPGGISSDHDHALAPAQSGAAASSVPAADTTPVVARTMAPSVRPVEPLTLEPTAGGHATPDLAARPEPPLESATPPGFTEVALPLAPTRTIVPAAARPMDAGVSDPVAQSFPAVPAASVGSSGGAAPVQRSLHVGAAVRPPTTSAALTLPDVPEMTERPTSGSVAADSFLTAITLGAVSALESGRLGSTVGPADESAPTGSSSRGASAPPSAQRLVTDSAVVPPSSASRLSSPGHPGTSPGAVSVPALGALAVGLPLVQRSTAAHQPSVPAGEAPTSGSASGSARSFASMFSETSPSSVAATVSGPRAPTLPVATLQRQSFGDGSSAATVDAAGSPPATEPAPDGGSASDTAEAPAPAAGTTSSAAAPPGAPAADVDEMARRLYEPLVARLRAELWLDRERSGVFGDG